MAIKQLQLAALPPEKGLTDLSIIGVPSSQFKKAPGVAGFPKKFNPEAQKVWTEMVQDPDFKQRCKNYPSLDLMWHNAIQEFLKRCEDTGVYPFINNADVTKNEFIQDFVRRARIDLVKYIDQSGLFERVKIRKAYREYVRKDQGLIITSWAELYPVKDDDFLKWLQTSPMPRFIKMTEGRYRRVVRPNVEIWVKWINSQRVTVSFTIEVAGSVMVPNKPIPKRSEVDKYIDNMIYLPTIRAHRFKFVKTRLF